MKRPTFTIASLMVAVLFVAVGCMALRGPTPLMASVVFSAAVVVLAAAVLLACVRNGRARAGWVGMAAFGLAYLHFGFVGGDPGYPAFITTAGYGWPTASRGRRRLRSTDPSEKPSRRARPHSSRGR